MPQVGLYGSAPPGVCTYIVRRKVQEIGRFSGLATGGRIYTNCTYWSLYTILCIWKKFLCLIWCELEMTVSAESVLLNKHQGKITWTVSWFMSTSIWHNINTNQKDHSKCNVTTSKTYSVAVEDNITANSEKITILEYKYGVKGNRGLSNSGIIVPIHYMWLNYLLFASNQRQSLTWKQLEHDS